MLFTTSSLFLLLLCLWSVLLLMPPHKTLSNFSSSLSPVGRHTYGSLESEIESLIFECELLTLNNFIKETEVE